MNSVYVTTKMKYIYSWVAVRVVIIVVVIKVVVVGYQKKV